ncbi:dipeptidase [Chloroflexota bacterium]
MTLIIDSHQDLAYNILTYGRDYTRSVSETRQLEENTNIPAHNGNTMLGWQEYQHGDVAIAFSTLFAAPQRRKKGDWESQAYGNTQEAHQLYSNQVDVYHRLVDEHPQKFSLIQDTSSLEDHIISWQEETKNHPVGLVILMEGAEGVREPAELELWWKKGVRIIGPAWAGTRFCGGTLEPGPLTGEGHALLAAMAEIGFTLDLSHMDELAARQALDEYPGAIIASHANCATLLPNFPANRLLKDDIIRKIIERNGTIGLVPMLPFLQDDWKKGDSRQGLTLDPLFTAQIDHICQLSGNSNHVAIGSDFDGGFGLESAPEDLDTIADLKKLDTLLTGRGYSKQDVEAIFGTNWLNYLKENLPS